MASETYNGWKNYPTWNVKLWLDNDEGLYLAAREMVEHVRADHETEGAQRFTLADELRAWVRDELAPDLGASFASDLLGYALDQVDWHEIADSYLAE